MTREAAAQLIGPNGSLGPLFADVALGGPAPSQATRDHIAQFARANRVKIDLDVVDDELTAIRLDVSFSGGCGYEGADVLALRLKRPSTGNCCVCGQDTWSNDWYVETEDGVHMRARVRVNRVVARWERSTTLPELLEDAEHLVGRDAAVVRQAAGDRWTELEWGRRYLIEVPYSFRPYAGYAVPLASQQTVGIQVVVEHGRVAEVVLALRDVENDSARLLRAALRSHWGRPFVKREDTWTWRTPDRTVTADVSDYEPMITIRKRG